MEEKRVTIIVDGKQLHLVLGKTEEEWRKLYWSNLGNEIWDFLLEELLDGTIDIDETIWYWYIGGRCYETNELVQTI